MNAIVSMVGFTIGCYVYQIPKAIPDWGAAFEHSFFAIAGIISVTTLNEMRSLLSR